MYIDEGEDNFFQNGDGAVLSVFCSPFIEINGALGQCYPLQKITSNYYFSKKEIGFGNTNCWYLGSIDSSKTITIVYEKSKTDKYDEEANILQFRLNYVDKTGEKVVKVSTVLLEDAYSLNDVSERFNQEAALLTLCRLYIHKSLYEEKRNYRLWLDKILLQWASVFANYIKGDERSFSLPAKMKYLPQYLYYFRRTNIFRREGISLDEHYYHCHILNRESV